MLNIIDKESHSADARRQLDRIVVYRLIDTKEAFRPSLTTCMIDGTTIRKRGERNQRRLPNQLARWQGYSADLWHALHGNVIRFLSADHPDAQFNAANEILG